MGNKINCYSTIMAVTLTSIGCSESGPTRYEASGTVTYEGEPVPAGTIRFLPDTARQNSGPAGFAAIRAGKYDTREGGKGTVGGKQIAVIDAFDGKETGEAELVAGRPLCMDYREPVDLPTNDAEQNFVLTKNAAREAAK